MINSIPSGAENNLFDMLRTMLKEQKEVVDASALEASSNQVLEVVNTLPTHTSTSSSASIMSQNFASAGRGASI